MVKADLHIHTVLSPCGDLEMSPLNIVMAAKSVGLDLIGVTDHNSTRQCAEVRRIGKREGLYVLCGAEITTREEVHVLAFAEWGEPLEALQEFIESAMSRTPNDPKLFGYQLVVDEDERVTYEEERLLIGATGHSIEDVERFVESVGGIFIPAHIDKPRDSLISQLGFVPPDLRADALEISPHCNLEKLYREHPYLRERRLVRSSDAHYIGNIGRTPQRLSLDRGDITFGSIKKSLQNAVLE